MVENFPLQRVSQHVVILSAGTSTHPQQLLTPGGPSTPNFQTRHDMIPQKTKEQNSTHPNSLNTDSHSCRANSLKLTGPSLWLRIFLIIKILNSQTQCPTLKQLLQQSIPKVEILVNYWGPQHHFERHTLN